MRGRIAVHVVQLAIVAAFLIAWEYVPQSQQLSAISHLFDPFFVSSPSRIAKRLVELATGTNGSFLIWPYVWPTLFASVIGTAVGMTSGGAAGLLLSNWRFASDVFQPFVVALNAVPRIALIPIIVLITGPTFSASIVISILVVFFVAFFSAYEGGRTVPSHLVQNAQVLGASRLHVLAFIRLPYVMAWTLAVLPLGITFAIISIVTGEILTGYPGMGRLISIASLSADSALTFSVVIVLSLLGLISVGLAEQVKHRLLHWWEAA
jgi:NitT/TauT family transport system permease protein